MSLKKKICNNPTNHSTTHPLKSHLPATHARVRKPGKSWGNLDGKPSHRGNPGITVREAHHSPATRSTNRSYSRKPPDLTRLSPSASHPLSKPRLATQFPIFPLYLPSPFPNTLPLPLSYSLPLVNARKPLYSPPGIGVSPYTVHPNPPGYLPTAGGGSTGV